MVSSSHPIIAASTNISKFITLDFILNEQQYLGLKCSLLIPVVGLTWLHDVSIQLVFIY